MLISIWLIQDEDLRIWLSYQTTMASFSDRGTTDGRVLSLYSKMINTN